MTCDRCKREVHPWLLKRRDQCSPKGWARCIRQYHDVQRTTQAKALGKGEPKP